MYLMKIRQLPLKSVYHLDLYGNQAESLQMVQYQDKEIFIMLNEIMKYLTE